MTRSQRNLALERLGVEPPADRVYFRAVLCCVLFIIGLWLVGYGLLKRPVYLPDDAPVVDCGGCRWE